MTQNHQYRADVDGLRAVAVLSVVLYHYGANWLPGGFTGVDIFFVISGFVITGKLRKEMEAGEFSILRFYDGRVRRIFPALLTMLAVTMAAGWFILMPGDYADLGESAAFAAFGLGNLFFYWNTGYFDQASELQPLLHTWSLGVEEQFYLAWPLVLWAALTFIRSRLALAILCLAIVAVGLVCAQAMLGLDPTAAFYLPHPRAWELAIGAALVFLPAVTHRVVSNVLAATGSALILYSLLAVHADQEFPGVNAAFACFGAALLIWPKSATPLSCALSLRPVVFIGLISYSLYLWHWPVLVLYRHYANGDMPSAPVSAVLVGVSALLSIISWRYVERPFRSRSAFPLRAINLVPSALLITALVSSCGLLTATSHGWPTRVTEEATRLNDIDAMWAWPCPAQVTPAGSLHERCSFGANWSSSKNRALLWGDSHAQHLAPILDTIGKREGISFILSDGCPAALGLSVHRDWPSVANFRLHCQDIQTDMERILASDPSIRMVVLASAWASLANHRIYSDNQGDSDLSKNELISVGLSEVADKVISLGKKVVLVENVPYPGRNLTRCAAGQASGLARAQCPTNINLGAKPDSFEISNKMINSQARDELVVVSPKRTMCNAGECISTIDGRLIWRDVSHLRRDLPVSIYEQLAELTGLAAALRSD